MELLSSTAINFKPCLSRLSLVSSPIQSSYSLQQPKKKFTHFLKLSSQNFLCQSSSSSSTRRSPVQLAVSDSAVAADTEPVMDKLPGDIEVTETEEPESRVRLSVTIPPVVCEDCYKRVIDEFSKRSRLPGFRKGKIPESLLVNHVGVASVRKATIESILRRTLPHAMTSVTGRALKDSVRLVTQFSEMDEFFSSHNYLRYEALVDVAPEVKWVPEDGYKNLNIVVEIDNDIDAETACEAEIKRRHKALGSLRIVTDRGLQVGDVALVDISTVKAGEEESVETIPSAESKGFQLDTEEAESLPPGFLDSVIGIKQGETKSFTLVFPESWRQENLRGVHAQFTVECKELFYRDLPVLDDSLAEKLLPGCSTLSQVRESILQRCKEVEQTAREQATDNAILDQTCKMVQVEIPQSLFEEQGRTLYGSKLLEIQANMKLTEEQLSSLSSPAAVNEYLKGQRENIINLVKMNLAVGDIFKRENLQYSTDELVEKVADSVNEFKRSNQEFDEDRVKDQVQEILEGAKVIEWLREHATIKYVTNGQTEKLEQ